MIKTEFSTPSYEVSQELIWTLQRCMQPYWGSYCSKFQYPNVNRNSENAKYYKRN